jgi:hypothetical protein
MRLPGRDHGCGHLLELGWVSRQLHLSPPVSEGTETIAVTQIVGTVSRARDFDGCWHPLQPALAKRIREIERANPVGVDEPVEVIRVDRAFFVVDGHKRVSLARRTGREFLDAHVSHLVTPYQLSADVETDAILRTAREGEFRRHSGMAEAVPDARFPLTELDAYGELILAVQAHRAELDLREGRALPVADAAADWYRSVYLPTVAEAREKIGGLLDECSDTDAFISIHRQRIASWGTECDAEGCAVDQVLAQRRLEDPSPVARLLRRTSRRRSAMLILPLADAQGRGANSVVDELEQ